MDRAAERHRVREVLQRGEVAMFVTLDDEGAHAGRPMLPLWLEDDPDIYFLTHQDSRKVGQLTQRPQVALTMIVANCYFVVFGSAYPTRDPDLIRRLWHPSYRAWFPAGKDDREATALRVVIARVNYWEPPSAHWRRLLQAAIALITRRAIETPMKTIDPW